MQYSYKVSNLYRWLLSVIRCLQFFLVLQRNDFRERLKYGKRFSIHSRVTWSVQKKRLRKSLRQPLRIVLHIYSTDTVCQKTICWCIWDFLHNQQKRVWGCLYYSLIITKWNDTKCGRVHWIHLICTEYIHKKVENDILLNGDSCSSNQSIAAKLKSSLLGCTDHRSRLSVCEVIAEEADMVETVQNLMVKHRTPVLRPKVRHHKQFGAELCKITRRFLFTACCTVMLRSESFYLSWKT